MQYLMMSEEAAVRGGLLSFFSCFPFSSLESTRLIFTPPSISPFPFYLHVHMALEQKRTKIE